MSKINWGSVTREHILAAINRFIKESPKHPEAISTFLIYGKKKLPAKHIRGMAYKEAFGKEISKADFSGGKETQTFFEKRGFTVFYSGTIGINDKPTLNPPKTTSYEANNIFKVGLYLQSDCVKNNRYFKEAVHIVKKSDLDILVFPEFCWTPFSKEYVYPRFGLESSEGRRIIKKDALALSKEFGKPLITNFEDPNGIVFSVYANAYAKNGDTEFALHIKHTQTNRSILEFENFENQIKDNYPIIRLNGFRIGMSICYDCTDAIFSRIYGIKGIDLIINSTGGDVVREKWHRYIQAKAIENNCYSFVTMGCDNLQKNFVLGFSPQGTRLMPKCLNGETTMDSNNRGGIYSYTVQNTIHSQDCNNDISFNQKPTGVKYKDICFVADNPLELLKDTTQIQDNVYIKHGPNNTTIIIILVNGEDIYCPEKIVPFFYLNILHNYSRKRFIIINDYPDLTEKQFKSTLSTILKVRSMENYCPVILKSPLKTFAVQACSTKNIQILAPENGLFWLDLNRASGPKILRDGESKQGKMIKNNYEWIINNLILNR